jgi:hypothetical protein
MYTLPPRMVPLGVSPLQSVGSTSLNNLTLSHLLFFSIQDALFAIQEKPPSPNAQSLPL